LRFTDSFQLEADRRRDSPSGHHLWGP